MSVMVEHGDYTLTTGQITTALDMHQIDWHRSITGQLWAEELATIVSPDGTVCDASSWVHAPATYRTMLDWLGY